MRKLFITGLGVVVLLLAISAAGHDIANAAPAITFDGSPGTAAPPTTLGPYNMTPFSDDTRACTDVTDVPDPAGTVTFSAPVNHRDVGGPCDGWSTWSNGYTGDVYYTNGASSLTLSLPAGTLAFYLYVEPNTFAISNVTATAQNGTTSGAVPVNGFAGATYFGFYATGGASIASIAISVAGDDFAVGEFGIQAPLRDVRRPADINGGKDLCGTGHTAVNFTGSAGSAGDTWITVYDTTPADNTLQNSFGTPLDLSTDVCIHRFDNKKGGGLLALYNEGLGKKGLAVIINDGGNTDTLVLSSVDQAGKLTTLASVPLAANIAENVWYRLNMHVVVTDSNVAVTATVFRHTTSTNPNSSLGTQVGATLSYSGALPAGVDASGEVGLIASATSAVVDTSLTNFTINGSAPIVGG